MTDEAAPLPVEPVSPRKVRRGSGNQKAWLRTARVFDLASFQRLREQGAGAKRIARALDTAVGTAQDLMRGKHWQQTPEKVRIFNRARGGSIDPETGMPTPNDLIRFGPRQQGVANAAAKREDGEKDLRQLIADTGASPNTVSEAMRRILALGGVEMDLPVKADTKHFQDEIDRKLARALALLDDTVMATATPGDLTRLVSMLIEKRALLRGEPTAIVRNEQRGSLDKVAALLLGELQRRGIKLPGDDARLIEGNVSTGTGG